MNRPKHKKNKNPLLPDDQQIDERNLIDAEESVELSIEDKVSLYWMENKAFILGCVVVLAALLVGVNGVKMYGESAKAKLQDAYAAAKTNDTLDTFILNSSKELGGFAALTVADEAYDAGEFARAAEFYALAESALGDNILAGRAALGTAFAHYSNDAVAEGIAKLNQIATNTALADAVRSKRSITSQSTPIPPAILPPLTTSSHNWPPPTQAASGKVIDYSIRQGQ